MRDSVKRLPHAAAFQLDERRLAPCVDWTRGTSGRRRRFPFNPLDNRHTTTAVALLLVVFLSSHLCAATYYVAKTGNDANPGTEAVPWLTIRHAANASVVVAGDTVLVKPGTYYEGDTLSFCVNSGVTFKSVTPLAAVIGSEIYVRQPNVCLDGFKFVYRRRWASQELKILADGCVLRDCEVAAVDGLTGGVGVLLGSGYLRNIAITGNTIHGFVSHGIYANQMQVGSVTHNTIYENGGNGIQAYPNTDSSLLAYNRCYDNGGSGLLLHGCYNDVHYNICYGNGFTGLRLYNDDYLNWNNNNDVHNNVCTNNNWCGLWIQDGPNLIRNNISAYNNWCGYEGQLFIDTSAAGEVTLDYNCYYPDGWIAFVWNGSSSGNYGDFAAYRNATGLDAHGICADPLFVDAAAHDFHLQATSPCIDASDLITPPGLDFEFVPTPQGAAVDVGAYEYHTFHSVPPTRDSAPDMSPPAADGLTLALAPNPLSGGVAKVRCSLPKAEPATFSVCDAAGRRVLAQTTTDGAGTASLDLRKLRAGVYLVGVTTGGFSTTRKLVVER